MTWDKYITNSSPGWGWIFIGLFLYSFTIFGQNLDSLALSLRTETLNPQQRMEVYDNLVTAYWESDARKSLDYGKQGIQFAQEQKDDKWRLILYNHSAMAFYYLGEYDSAYVFLDHALQYANEVDDPFLTGNIYMNKGSVFKIEAEYPKALAAYFQALTFFKQAKHERAEGMLLQNISIVYLLLRKTELAQKYLDQAEKIAIKLQDQENLGSILLSKSQIYKDTDIPQAIATSKRAVKIFEELGSKHHESVALSVLGQSYLEAKAYNEAAQVMQKSFAIAQQLDYPTLLATQSIQLSNARFYQGQYMESENLAYYGLEKDSSNMEVVHNALFNIIRNNMYLGNLKKAEDYIDQYYESVQRFATVNYQASLSEMEVKYESQQKIAQIDSLQKQRRLYVWLGISAFIIFLVVLGLVFFRYRLAVSKRKLAEQQTKRLDQEKQLVAVKATLDGESAERSRLAKDLHDGLGSMLSLVKFNLPDMHAGVLEANDVSRFQKAIGLLDESIHELRRVAHHMMPESLLRFGLKLSLSDFAAAIPMVNFHYFGDEKRLPGNLEVMIYRCVHELVNNSLKHGNPTQINIQLVQQEDRISFTVQDNGSGFDPKQQKEGMGLQNIRQRVEAFKGKLNCYSNEKGTETHVELELQEQH